MATTIVDKSPCTPADDVQETGQLPVSPFTALQFHFGMLLGVDDLETGQAYPRGKIRLHNAWLHREGVVWGFNVAFNDRKELTVDRGLALDAAGHELHLDRTACVDLGLWFKKHSTDAGLNVTDVGTQKKFDIRVVAKFKACFTRPVPAIAEPCVGVENDTAFSRVFETVELLVRPGLSKRKDPGYHRLRVLFEIEPDSAAFMDVQTRRQTIQALPVEKQPAAYLDALREFAALDEIDLQPQAATAVDPASIFPEDPTELVLADVKDVLVAPTADGGWAIAAPIPTPAVTVRPSHIATATIQELLCGPRFVGTSGGATTGPAVTDATLTVAAAPPSGSITFKTSRTIAAKTLTAAAFSVTDYDDASGWTPIDINAVSVQGDGSMLIDLKSAPKGTLVRLIIRGTGPTPLVASDDHAPLGALSSRPDDGVDFVKMFKRS
jgi:hypothetical protein